HGPDWPGWFVGGELDLFENLVGRRARATPDQPAMLWESEDGDLSRFTWRELDDAARRLTTALARLGVCPAERSAVFLPMVPETAVVFLAAARLCAIV
ncbi:AMP-binding protein, partial [Denitromonas iodatirespirans]